MYQTKRNGNLELLSYKRTTCFFAIIFLCVALFANTAPSPPSNFGDANAGTAENPYLISNLANLRWLSETPDVWGEVEEDEETEEYEIISKFYFRQTANIDASETIDWNEGEGFTPIGFALVNIYEEEGEAFPFVGDFDGGNFIISNLYFSPIISYEEQLTIGLFGYTIHADISNVNLHNIEIIGGFSVGAIIGFAENSSIQNSGAIGSISGETDIVGGLAGQIVVTTIENCYSVVNIDVNSRAGTGGLVGAIIDSALSNSFFYGTIFDENDSASPSIGGITGMAMFGVIENVYVVITDASDNVYGFVADFTFSDISYSFWDNEISGIAEGFRSEIFCEITDCFGLPTAEMKIASTFISHGWDFDDVWTIDPSKNDGYPILRFMPDPIVSGTDKVTPFSPAALLHANYPNPFNPMTTISFEMIRSGAVTIDIFNIRGQKIRSLVSGMYTTGSHSVVWNGLSDNGQSVSSGVYFYQMTTGEYNTVKRMVLMK